MSAESVYNTSKADSGELVESLLGGSALNYVGHRACRRKASQTARGTNISVELAEIFKQKEPAESQEKNCFHRETRNGAWLSAKPHRLNSTELSREELRDNLRLRYGLMPQDTPETCDGCGKRFLIEHALSCPKGGLVLTRHNDAAKEWGTLEAPALVPSTITYNPKINSRTVQGKRTGDGARLEGGEADGSTDTVGACQGGKGKNG